ncbi:hypothetical protein CFC21_059020 [Triticum aestivum]|uniref:WW domain-containing protein n=2 Tax=Triticum aestivum TaxID=4565 RepID=A0A9R1KE24_WHEAT|nr:uncharacterized protein LOC123093460 [Triticum aestivum]XP_044371372.1 uncharacterized protein LOC123093460 [Triticum aestivum]KAF7050694.1 hypothetical protein CFC21_059020 [Triticum aestivum]
MVSLQSALLPEASKRPPCLSFADASVVASTATSKKRKRDGEVEEEDEEHDGIELNFDAAPLPLEWQRCLDIKSGQIHYYNTRTHKRTSKDPRRHGGAAPAVEEDVANCGPQGLDLDLNLAFEPRHSSPVKELQKKAEAKPAAAGGDRHGDQAPGSASGGMEMVAAVCMRCHMLVMMCRACPACPNCKFLHPTSRPTPPPPEPAPLKLGLQLLCCRD